MFDRTPAIALGFAASAILAAAAFAQPAASPEKPQPESSNPLVRSRELPEYTASGDLKLPKNWRDWIMSARH